MDYTEARIIANEFVEKHRNRCWFDFVELYEGSNENWYMQLFVLKCTSELRTYIASLNLRLPIYICQ